MLRKLEIASSGGRSEETQTQTYVIYSVYVEYVLTALIWV